MNAFPHLDDTPTADLRAAVAQASTTDTLRLLCRRQVRALGFDYFEVRALRRDSIDAASRITLEDLPTQWTHRYKTENLEKHDPVLRTAMTSSIPFFWDELKPKLREEQYVLQIAKRHRLTTGLTIPIKQQEGWDAFLSVSRERADSITIADKDRLLAECLLIGWLVADRLVKLNSDLHAQQRLSERERQCLQLAAEGLSNVLIGMRLQISKATVAFHIGNCFLKMGATTRAEAVRKAIRLGELSIGHPLETRLMTTPDTLPRHGEISRR